LKHRIGLFHWQKGSCKLLYSFNEFPLTKDFGQASASGERTNGSK
jgi:hypothetical protein